MNGLTRLFTTLASLVGISGVGAAPGKQAPRSPVVELRARALAMSPSDIGLSKSTYSDSVWGVLMDVGLDGGAAYTLVVLGDGTTSLYFSTGGGVIGAGEHAPVRVASSGLLAEAGRHLPSARLVSSTTLPGQGMVQFYLRTFDGTFSYAAEERQLAEGHDPYSGLFGKAQDVITQIRLQQERQKP